MCEGIVDGATDSYAGQPDLFLNVTRGVKEAEEKKGGHVTHPAGRPTRGWVGKDMRVGGWVSPCMPPARLGWVGG